MKIFKKPNITFKAYTLLEILVVLTIIGILMAVGLATYTKVQETAMKKAMQMEMKQYSIAIYNYKIDKGNIPGDVDILLNEGYITKELSTDPWETKYKIEYNETTHILKITSAGPDKKFGTSDDYSTEENI